MSGDPLNRVMMPAFTTFDAMASYPFTVGGRRVQVGVAADVGVGEREDGSAESLSYRELEVRVREFAAGLAKLGVVTSLER